VEYSYSPEQTTSDVFFVFEAFNWETQKIVADLEKIFSATGKMVAVLQNIFSFVKKIFAGSKTIFFVTKIIFMTSETMVAASKTSVPSLRPLTIADIR